MEYAILEQNGLLSVFPKIENQQATLKQLGIDDTESGIVHIIISQGTWNEHNLKSLNKDKEEFEKYMRKKGISQDQVFLLTIDDNNKKQMIAKEVTK